MPYKIGRMGQFQEWVEDIDDPNCQHRHLSHLLASAAMQTGKSITRSRL